MRIAAAARRVRRRWATTPPWAIDVVLGTTITAMALATTIGRPDPGDVYRDVDVVAVVLALASAMPYYLRRHAPLAVFAVTSIAVAAVMLRGYNEGALPMVLLLGAYTLGAYRGPREVVAGIVLISGVVAALFLGDVPEFGLGDMVLSQVAFPAAILAGRAVRSRSQRVELLEHDQADSASRAAAEERLRIAQELHDIVAHSLGVIALQAGVGLTVIDTDTAEARRSFESISRLSRSSLGEIRRLLSVVRSGQGAPTYAPPPSLSDVGRLARDVSDAGLPVDLTLDGDLECIPAGVGLAAYRIVQEALTNALRHAAAGEAKVRLERTRGSLLVEVTDDGRGPNGKGATGHGLVGMRERAAVYGGSVEAGAGIEGGFRVVARLPFDLEPGA
jgi:signal transduction histidine kinase